MKTKKLYKIHKQLAKELGEDMVIGLALDNGNYFLSVSCHKSTQKFKTDRNMQTCQLSDLDLDQDSDVLVKQIVKLYSGILYTPDENDDKGDSDETE